MANDGEMNHEARIHREWAVNCKPAGHARALENVAQHVAMRSHIMKLVPAGCSRWQKNEICFIEVMQGTFHI